jgi:sporulation protein YlmC with PRC-barrel domain
MLFRVDKLMGMSLYAEDGVIGHVIDVYFDDHRWAIRHLVVQTGHWFDKKKVLISPMSINDIDWYSHRVSVSLNQIQIRNSPDIDTDKPVSRQLESRLFRYYGYPDYMVGPLLWGRSPTPAIPASAVAFSDGDADKPQTAEHLDDRHLRSLHEVSSYRLQATDVEIGHLEDLMVDPDTWAIRYIVVDTRNWLPGRHVLIPPQWITRLDWDQKNVYVEVSHEDVSKAPPYDPYVAFSSLHEQRFYEHYHPQPVLAAACDSALSARL